MAIPHLSLVPNTPLNSVYKRYKLPPFMSSKPCTPVLTGQTWPSLIYLLYQALPLNSVYTSSNLPPVMSGSMLSQLEGQILIDIMNDHGLEKMVHFPTREKNTLDLILTTVPGQCQDIHSPDKLSDHDIVSGNLKIFIPPIKKSQKKVYLYQKESMRKDTPEFAKENTSMVTGILVQYRRTLIC